MIKITYAFVEMAHGEVMERTEPKAPSGEVISNSSGPPEAESKTEDTFRSHISNT